MREQIDSALADGDNRTALAGLELLWEREPGSITAGFVNSRYRRLAREGVTEGRFRSLTTHKLAILRSFTVEPLLPLLEAMAWVAGIRLEFHLGEFNAWAQELRDPAGAVAQFAPDTILLALDGRTAWPDLLNGGAAEAALAAVESAIEAFQATHPANFIVHNACPQQRVPDGLLDGRREGGIREQVAEFNRLLGRMARARRGVYVLDYEALAARHGYTPWQDERKWESLRQPLAAASLLPMAREWMRFLHPLTGKLAKVCVTDLDNTLWGGVIGEDGLEGLQLSADPPGAHWQAVQRVLLNLYDRGILLAIASKNNPEEALEAIDRHPGMILRRQHFAAHQIHWNEKAGSLAAIAAELNLGIDSLAFVDDNPVERQRVREELPEVWVVDLPEQPSAYAATIAAQPCFERLTLSQEDRERGQLYQAERERTALRETAGSVEDFLRSLEQQVELLPVTPQELPRAAQLTQKTNQFNLTTRRYTEQEIAARIADGEAWEVRAMRVRDRYGDHGLVGLAMMRCHGQKAEIDTFLLSCRVISRGVESALLAWLAAEAARRNCTTLSGWYLPTRKNAPCRDFYAQHGFHAAPQDGDGSALLWERDLSASLPPVPDWIVLRTSRKENNQ